MSEVKARMSMDSSEFQAGIDKASAKLQSFASGQLHHIKGAIAGAFTIGAIETMMHAAIELGEKFDNLSKRTGVSAEELQKMDIAAKRNGTSIEAYAQAVTKLSVNLSKAINGNQEAVEHFEALGVSLQDLKTKSADEIFLQIADAVKKSTDPTQTMADVVAVMGRNAGELVPLLQEGSEGIKKIGGEAEKSGMIIKNSVISELHEAGDMFAEFGRKILAWIAPLAVSVSLLANMLVGLGRVAGKGFVGMVTGDFSPAVKALNDLSKVGERKTESKKPIVDLERESRDPAAEKEAERKEKRIEQLAKSIVEERERLALEALEIEQQITSLKEKQLILTQEQAQSTDLEEQLQKEKEILDINQKLFELNKKKESEDLKRVEEFGKQVHAREEFMHRIDDMKRGKGVSVEAPITDSLARIGGFVGNSGDPNTRILERHTKILEDIREETKKFNREHNAAGDLEDFHYGEN